LVVIVIVLAVLFGPNIQEMIARRAKGDSDCRE
jgi:hypothetical protein